ncbi:hypothetical protein GQ53DRAFT_818464 [Thozetella sp. PMI_491]|nr:hypothetical protein GQ53DRAFT_818464 [Thozetella sp. PMI_491]
MSFFFASPGSNQNLVDAAKNWVNEGDYYTYGPIPTGDISEYGRYTQIVWNTTRRLGMAWAQNGKDVFVIAFYDPPGNT